MREPLAETLGAFREEDAVMEYSFIDAVKLAGHACPSVTGAYLSCQLALSALYGDDTPVRGDIRVTVYGEPDEGALGVMAQVCTFITGAAPGTGFKGLGPLFKRKDLLRFAPADEGCGGVCLRFERIDTGRSVQTRFRPGLIPFPEEKGKQLSDLMKLVVHGAVSDEQRTRFQDLWMEKIELMAVRKIDIDKWLELLEA
ncbi:MAG: hypothetical protein ACYC6Z_08555 [Thermoleophilia bacterium]